jgi:hypothetical protein
MLSIALGTETTVAEEEKFDAHLRGSGWMKFAHVQTSWFTCYKEKAVVLDIINEAKQDVAAAVKYSKIVTCNAVINVSESEPSSF